MHRQRLVILWVLPKTFSTHSNYIVVYNRENYSDRRKQIVYFAKCWCILGLNCILQTRFHILASISYIYVYHLNSNIFSYPCRSHIYCRAEIIHVWYTHVIEKLWASFLLRLMQHISSLTCIDILMRARKHGAFSVVAYTLHSWVSYAYCFKPLII